MEKQIFDAQNQYKLGRIDRAMVLFSEIINKDATNKIAYQGLAQCKFDKKDYESASSACEKALELDSSLYLPHLIKANIFWRKNEFKKCEEELRMSLSLDPSKIDLYFSLANLLFVTNRYIECLGILIEANDIENNNWKVASLKADVLKKLKRNKEAFDELKKAYILHPSISLAHRVVSYIFNRYWYIYIPVSTSLFFFSLFAPIRISLPSFLVISIYLFFMSISFLEQKKTRVGVLIIVILLMIILSFVYFHA